MAALAAFATSPQGAAFVSHCDRWGIDPAAEIADPVLAHNFRYALAVATSKRSEGDERADKLADDLERIKSQPEWGG